MQIDEKRFNLGYISSRTAAADPDRLAVVDLRGGRERRFSYRELEERLDQLAAALAGLRLPLGERVALLVGNRFEYIQVMYGALRAGLCPVLVNTKLGLQGLKDTLSECDPRVVVVDPSCNAAAVEAASGIEHRIMLDAQQDGWIDFDDWISAAPAAFDPPKMSSLAMGELCFTSGSTGRPKGVMISHRGALLKLHAYACNERALRDGPIRSLIHLPIFHGNARLSSGIAFETGGVVVIQESFDPRATLENIARYRINYLLSVNAAYVAMFRERELFETLDLSSLRFPLVGSAPAGGNALQDLGKALNARVLHAYGSTEAGTVLQHRVEDDAPLSSCGKVLPGNEVKLVDPATGESGDFGELWIRSEWLALGYWRRPEETAARFAEGWYRSGDLFQRDEKGRYSFRGRADDMFNVGGEKVYPLEVENTLQRHPMVAAVSVVALENEAKGHVPVAMVVAAKDSNVTEDELRQFCLASGPAYASPRRIIFVDSFPTAATGKIDRLQVKAAFLSGEA